MSPEQLTRHQKAQNVIRNHVLWSVGSGFIPMPLADLAALSSLQVSMIEQLARVYGLEHEHSATKSLVQALAGSSLAKLVARFGLSFLKSIPIIGSIGAGLAMSISAGASTYALGQVVVEQFERAKPLSSLDLKQAEQRYQQAYETGKQVAESLHTEADTSPTAQTASLSEAEAIANPEIASSEPATQAVDIFKAIHALGELRDKGYLSQGEFEQEKRKLLARL